MTQPIAVKRDEQRNRWTIHVNLNNGAFYEKHKQATSSGGGNLSMTGERS